MSIAKPNADCGSISPGRQVMNVDENKYRVDEDTFELVISSVTAIADSDQYRCELWVLNPATTIGQTAQFRSFPTTLVVDGKHRIFYKLHVYHRLCAQSVHFGCRLVTLATSHIMFTHFLSLLSYWYHI